MSLSKITDNKILNGSVIALSFLLAVILIILSSADLTNRDTALLGTILTFVSILAGGLITHAYAEGSKEKDIAELAELHQKNLRTYALKAAEKVTNLSKELGRLSAYLEDELDETDYRSTEEELLAKEERIESAIHMLTTLKSVNDTSLSDWQGVIGDEIIEQRVEEAERTEELKHLLERFSSLEANKATARQFDATILQNELKEVRRDLRNLATEMTGMPFKRNSEKGYALIDVKCPSCGNAISYRQKPRESSPKALTCKHCQINLLSEYSETQGFHLRIRKSIPENIVCPSCEEQLHIQLDELPTASATVKCTNCEESLRLSRSSGIIKVNLIHQLKSKYPLTDEIIERIRIALPQQPWPRQIHKTVADSLGLPHQQVQRAIQHLIRMGVFLDQVDGQICTTEEKLILMRGVGTNL